jgi:hypothetical protein
MVTELTEKLAKQVPRPEVYQVSWTFHVAADSQEIANGKIEATMKDFAKFMNWPEPEKLEK